MDVVRDQNLDVLEQLLLSTAHPRERFDLARSTILVPQPLGMWNQAQEHPPFQVMEAVLRDGYDLRAAQQVYGLFSPARKIRASAWALEQLRSADAYAQGRALVARAAALIDAAILPPTLQLAIIPADPSNRNLMIRNAGLSVLGGGGRLAAEVWPSADNLGRLGPALVRGLALGVRWQATGAAQRYTLADALAAEGLAAVLVSAVFPNIELPWLIAHAAPPSWPGDLQAIADLYGVANYAKVPANSYGRSEWRDVAAPPAAAALDPEELAYAEDVIAAALGSDDPRTIAAHLYGDAITAEQGHPQAGLPPYAGFEVAYRMVQRRGQGPGAALGLATEAIIDR